MSTYTKSDLLKLIVEHGSAEVRMTAAESLYARGFSDGGREVREVLDEYFADRARDNDSQVVRS